MALTFPAAPTVGDQHTEANRTWEWNGATWEAIATADFSGGALIVPVSSSAATAEGSLTFDGVTDKLYIGDGTTAIEIGAGGGGATTLDSLTDVTAAGATNGQLLTADGAGNFTFTTVSGVSSTLAGLTDVDVTGQTNGQVLTTDGAGNFTFTTPYGDTDVATYLDGNLSANIIPDTDYTYDIGSATNRIKFGHIQRIYVQELSANYMYYQGDIVLSANTGGTVNAVRPYSTAYSSDLGSTTIPWSSTYTDNLTVNTSLTVDGTVNSNIIPDGNNTRDLGDISNYWRDSYVNQMFANRINVANYLTLPINSTPAVADGSITWDGTNDKLYVGNGVIAIEIGAGGGSVALDDVTDVTAAGSTAGQMLTSDGAGAYTFTTPYGDTDVATYLNGNLNTDIIPDTNIAYDIGSSTNRISYIWTNRLEVAQRLALDGGVEGHLKPLSDGTYTLGENFTRWLAVYAQSGVFTNLDLSSSVTFAIPNNTTAQTADGALTWNATTKELYVGNGSGSQLVGGGSYSDTDVATYLNGNLNTHIIPDTNATYDIGAAEFKIRHLYLSDNSLKFVNASNTEYSMGVDGDGELTFQSVKLSDAAVAKVTSADLDMGGNRVLFANVYTNLVDLPDASAYHGMFAHVHSEAAAYYAHAGSWVALANKDEVTGASRNQYSGTTASINNQESGNLDVTGCKTYTLFKITTDKAAWVTLYADAASRTADTRTYADKGSDPSTSGVIAEVITTGGETVLIAPGVVGFNNESTPTTNIPMKVWNDSGSAGTVTVTVDVLTLEA